MTPLNLVSANASASFSSGVQWYIVFAVVVLLIMDCIAVSKAPT